MTAKEDKKTPARVGRVPGLILPSLGGVLVLRVVFCAKTLYLNS